MFFSSSNILYTPGEVGKFSKKTLLISSYHCSKLNINTNKIDYKSLFNLFMKAKEMAYDE